MRKRAGFSLIEVMVAITILAIVLLGLARASTAIGVRARTNDIVAKRSAALQLEANKLGAVPYATLATWSTTDTVITLGSFSYRRHLTITAAGPTRYTLNIVVIPVADSTRRDSIMLDRTLPPSTSPLCKGC